MEVLWQRLVAWGKKSGAGSPKLAKRASKSDIALAESTLELTFPADFRESLGWCDGQDPEPDFPWMPGCSPLQPLSAIVARYQYERTIDGAQRGIEDESADGRHKLCLWHPQRIPIAGTPWWDGDNTYLDLVPGKHGTRGQLITFTSESDLVVLGSSMREALEKYVVLLERGRLVWDASNERVVPKDGEWNGHPAEAFAAMSV